MFHLTQIARIMIKPQSPFETGLKLMGAQQQLAARSLINLIEMISASSHRYTQETTDFTRDAVSLMQKASTTRDAGEIAELQNQWTRTCMKYGENQTRATMQFVEQCGQQALNIAASAPDISTKTDD
ncbi:MAG: phasin [Asticcacaulis sp.]